MQRSVSVVVGCCLVIAFMAGMGSGMSVALAVDPNPCPMYKCKEIHAYWPGNSTATGHLLKGTTTSTVNGYTDIFATTSTKKHPLQAPNTTQIDVYVYAACVPTCGKDKDGVWQATQEVSLSGQGTKLMVPIDQELCTDLTVPDRGIAPQVTDPTNKNTGKNNPPGY